jgi:hypothetical protein
MEAVGTKRDGADKDNSVAAGRRRVGGLGCLPVAKVAGAARAAGLAHTARKAAAAGHVEPYSEAIELAVGLIGALKAVYVAEGRQRP